MHYKHQINTIPNIASKLGGNLSSHFHMMQQSNKQKHNFIYIDSKTFMAFYPTCRELVFVLGSKWSELLGLHLLILLLVLAQLQGKNVTLFSIVTSDCI